MSDIKTNIIKNPLQWFSLKWPTVSGFTHGTPNLKETSHKEAILGH